MTPAHDPYLKLERRIRRRTVDTVEIAAVMAAGLFTGLAFALWWIG